MISEWPPSALILLSVSRCTARLVYKRFKYQFTCERGFRSKRHLWVTRFILLKIPIWVSAWDCLGIHGKAQITIRSRAGTHVSRRREKFSAWWRIKETIRDCMRWNSPHSKPQGRPCRTTRINETHVGSYIGQCGARFSTWWPIKETIRDRINKICLMYYFFITYGVCKKRKYCNRMSQKKKILSFWRMFMFCMS